MISHTLGEPWPYGCCPGLSTWAVAAAWECPRCKRMNAPHVERCDCPATHQNVEGRDFEWIYEDVKVADPDRPECFVIVSRQCGIRYLNGGPTIRFEGLPPIP